MSVIVKGMKMPKKCICCPLSHWNKLDELTGCELHQKHIPNAEKEFWEKDRPDWCPLIEVPTPHGDLIDKEDLRKEIIHHLGIKSEEYLLPAEKSIVNKIIDAPTIIEAEEMNG